MSRERICVVEDEPDIAEVLSFNLERAGYAVDAYGRGDTALEAIRKEPPDLVVLDLMLPGLDGLEVTRALKRDPSTSRVPLVMLTAKGEEVDRIVGLELGADDYIPKPFSPREVVLRIRAVLRRRAGGDEGATERLRAGTIVLDPEAHRVEVRGKEISLTATEFRLLERLLERQGRVQTRSRLLADVWGYADDVDSRTVDTHVRRLRRKLGGVRSRRDGDRRRLPPQVVAPRPATPSHPFASFAACSSCSSATRSPKTARASRAATPTARSLPTAGDGSNAAPRRSPRWCPTSNSCCAALSCARGRPPSC